MDEIKTFAQLLLIVFGELICPLESLILAQDEVMKSCQCFEKQNGCFKLVFIVLQTLEHSSAPFLILTKNTTLVLQCFEMHGMKFLAKENWNSVVSIFFQQRQGLLCPNRQASELPFDLSEITIHEKWEHKIQIYLIYCIRNVIYSTIVWHRKTLQIHYSHLISKLSSFVQGKIPSTAIKSIVCKDTSLFHLFSRISQQHNYSEKPGASACSYVIIWIQHFFTVLSAIPSQSRF